MDENESSEKTIAIFAATICMVMPLHASAVELEVQTEITAMDNSSGDIASPQAAGLISSYFLYCGATTNKVRITASLAATGEMAKIGFTDIKVQRSANGSSGWTTVAEPADQVIQNAYSHELSAYSVSVTGGYYYRVVLTNYAKEPGWFFPTTQSVSCTSNVIWVPAS